MISISKAHYDSLIELIHLTNRNLTLLAPNALVGLAQNWAHLNTQLEALYHKIDNQMQDIISRNGQLQSMHIHLKEQLEELKTERSQLQVTNTHYHSELTKVMGDNVKLKDIIRNMKEDISAKMLGKDKLMEELVGKARRYKKECEEQGRQLKRLEAKLVCQVVAQESLLKGNELDDELAQLERELQQLENQQDAGVGSAAE